MSNIKNKILRKNDKRVGKKPTKELTSKINKLLETHTFSMLSEKLDFPYRTLKKISSGEETVMPHVLKGVAEKLNKIKSISNKLD